MWILTSERNLIETTTEGDDLPEFVRRVADLSPAGLMGMTGWSEDVSIRTRDFLFTDGSYLVEAVGRSPQKYTAQGTFSMDNATAVGNWNNLRLLSGERVSVSYDGAAIGVGLVNGVNSNFSVQVDGRALTCAWRLDITMDDPVENAQVNRVAPPVQNSTRMRGSTTLGGGGNPPPPSPMPETMPTTPQTAPTPLRAKALVLITTQVAMQGTLTPDSTWLDADMFLPASGVGSAPGYIAYQFPTFSDTNMRTVAIAVPAAYEIVTPHIVLRSADGTPDSGDTTVSSQWAASDTTGGALYDSTILLNRTTLPLAEYSAQWIFVGIREKPAGG